MKIAVIIPTYNEKDNITELVPRIFELAIKDLHIVIVDDNSPDRTWEEVEKMKKIHSELHLIKRPKKDGLGGAYREGFDFALEKGADYFFEMDADLSHDYKMIPDFLQQIEKADLVVGSRYIPGGKTINWDWKRRWVSHFGNLYARTILQVPIRDLTTGFKCYKRNVIEHLKSKRIDSVGYVFQVETSYWAHSSGFKVHEIPIIFVERRAGFSKFNFKIILESFWKVLKIRLSQRRND